MHTRTLRAASGFDAKYMLSVRHICKLWPTAGFCITFLDRLLGLWVVFFLKKTEALKAEMQDMAPNDWLLL